MYIIFKNLTNELKVKFIRIFVEYLHICVGDGDEDFVPQVLLNTWSNQVSISFSFFKWLHPFGLSSLNAVQFITQKLMQWFS